MNDLCTDVGYHSLFKSGEQLCGDNVDVVDAVDGSKIIVLADGMGSGVTACILSTLTSKIISTMMAEGINIEECVNTITQTLPVASNGVAYSTFTIIRVKDSEVADIIQYDNPHVIFLRNGERMDYPETVRYMHGRSVYMSNVRLRCGDVMVSMSDGVIGASDNNIMNPNWQRDDVTNYLEAVYHNEYTAKDICTLLLDQCNTLYGGVPDDDVTACVVRICRREQVNLAFGPPCDKEDDERMMKLFFSKAGSHIICGGTTAKIAGRYLNRFVVTINDLPDPDIPPISKIDGVELVTEGMITMTRVLEYATNYAADNSNYFDWGNKKDGASMISKLLFEKATDINLFVGRAVNEAQLSSNSVNFSEKMRLVDKLTEQLQKMGKNVKVVYF